MESADDVGGVVDHGGLGQRTYEGEDGRESVVAGQLGLLYLRRFQNPLNDHAVRVQRPRLAHDERQRERILDAVPKVYPPHAAKEDKGGTHPRLWFYLTPALLFCPFEGTEGSPGAVVALPLAFSRKPRVGVVRVVSGRARRDNGARLLKPAVAGPLHGLTLVKEGPLFLNDASRAQHNSFLVPKQLLYHVFRIRFGGNVIKHRVLPISVGI
jgi:hypothetical protein